jgi:hypothetical protein
VQTQVMDHCMHESPQESDMGSEKLE